MTKIISSSGISSRGGLTFRILINPVVHRGHLQLWFEAAAVEENGADQDKQHQQQGHQHAGPGAAQAALLGRLLVVHGGRRGWQAVAAGESRATNASLGRVADEVVVVAFARLEAVITKVTLRANCNHTKLQF
jgi:hypothetical protein